MMSAAIETAVSSGVRAPKSSPMGLDNRLSSASVSPAVRSRFTRSSWVRPDPIAPTYPTSGRRSATSSTGTSNFGSWVSTQITVVLSIAPTVACAARYRCGQSTTTLSAVGKRAAVANTGRASQTVMAIEAGQTLFGESRVQEARAKIPDLPSNLRWHFVGHLQKNKIRHALPLFEMIHSVDSLALAEEINRIAEEEGLHPRVLLEVNVAGEGSKFGFASNRLREQMEELLALPRLSIEGLMCLPPLAEEAEASRKYFVQLRELRDSLEKEIDLKLPQLSMGMTDDFPVAVEEGATLVRVGTAIFGKRTRPKRE